MFKKSVNVIFGEATSLWMFFYFKQSSVVETAVETVVERLFASKSHVNEGNTLCPDVKLGFNMIKLSLCCCSGCFFP